MTNFLENVCTFKGAKRERNGDEMKRNVERKIIVCAHKKQIQKKAKNIYSVVECTGTFAVLMFQSEQLG